MGTPDIKVISGVRRSGKSKLLDAFKTYILSVNPDANIIYINFNMPEYEELLTYRALYDYINERYNPENEKKLLSFYRNNRFSQFDTRQTAAGADEPYELVQFLRLL